MPREINKKLNKDYVLLMVDDDRELLDSYTPILKSEGYSVLSTTDGIEAIDIIKNQNVDILLLDYFMPGLNGEEVVNSIRKFNKELVIILHTGYSGQLPPFEMLNRLEIQDYHSKSDGPDKLLLSLASGTKYCELLKLNKQKEQNIMKLNDGMKYILDSTKYIFEIQDFNEVSESILDNLKGLVNFNDGFILVEKSKPSDRNKKEPVIVGKGKFKGLNLEEVFEAARIDLVDKVKQKQEIVRDEDTIIFPMLDKDKQILGMLYVDNCDFDDNIMNIIKIYLNQASAAIKNTRSLAPFLFPEQ